MFALTTPTRAKLHKIDDKAIKVGQKDTRPAVILTLSVHLPNTVLDQFDPKLREVFYGKGSPGEKALKQSKLEGVDEVSDTPALTRTGQNLMTLPWGEEQSGCSCTIDYGTGDDRSNLSLKDGTTKGYKISLQEGGTVKVGFRFHAPIDHLSPDQIGRLHLMHQRDVKILLEGPKVEQPDLQDGSAPPVPQGNTITPIQALKKADKDHKAANSGKAKDAA